jgi:hypothetical protein
MIAANRKKGRTHEHLIVLRGIGKILNVEKQNVLRALLHSAQLWSAKCNFLKQFLSDASQ